ncbi:hypothetical protein U0035_08770 [Niabella yanshanensis]|uniref:Uncharacterized protein n=1 Tax=Niabella yanshanensis TaxID=577386 RepID=A0ABZ0WAA7_9BACT|nr:hypothetical protein [Niabella yanshanensis]WQD40235.1 hypothetical protein U0035_08770 [Niabella yanshanensis]
MKSGLHKWFYWGIVNLAIVALYGAVMRYKIAFHFPFFEQKNLLHAHSHFAFNGWTSHILYCGLTAFLARHIAAAPFKKYKILLGLNLICSFGMLFSFTIQGYKATSITFSTLSIALAVTYALFFFKDQKHLPINDAVKPWWKAALLLNVLSSAGPFALAYLMITHIPDQQIYLGSIYFYLHFQYSGWFFFGSVAMIVSHLNGHLPTFKKHFTLFAITVIPTFFLSLLWTRLPPWLYFVTAAATILQLAAWISLLVKAASIARKIRTTAAPSWINWFFYAAGLALTLKFVLQAISVIPSVSQLVFGFRPIIIAYLHLVLLGVYSLFFIGLLISRKIIRPTSTAKVAAFSFLSGVLLNELLLGLQGLAAFAYRPIPFINEMLFGAALLLLASAMGLVIAQFNCKKNTKRSRPTIR